MDNKAFEMIDKYAKELADMEQADGSFLKIYVNLDGECFETADYADFKNLREEDLTELDPGSVYTIEEKLIAEKNEINAIVLSGTPYCRLTADRGRDVEAALDDMAQIVGSKAYTTDYSERTVRGALKKAAGCFVRDKYTITTGRSLYEAVVALTVLEKSAEVNLKADVIGGVRTIPKIEAKLMRLIYQKKYSKAEQTVKSKEGR